MYSSGYGRCTEADLTGTLYLSNMNKIYVLKYALCLRNLLRQFWSGNNRPIGKKN